MKTILCALLAAGLLAGCGGGGDEEEPASKSTPAPAKTEAPAATKAPADADAEAEIREAFTGYNEALADRDFGKACEKLAPETTDKLRANVTKLGITDPPKECAEVLALVYKTVDKNPEQSKLVDEITKSAKINTIEVNGDTATINWSAQANGQNTPISQTVRLVDGEWKLVDVTG